MTDAVDNSPQPETKSAFWPLPMQPEKPVQKKSFVREAFKSLVKAITPKKSKFVQEQEDAAIAAAAGAGRASDDEIALTRQQKMEEFRKLHGRDPKNQAELDGEEIPLQHILTPSQLAIEAHLREDRKKKVEQFKEFLEGVMQDGVHDRFLDNIVNIEQVNGGLAYTLTNGHKLFMLDNYNGKEFIGIVGQNADQFDAIDAATTIAACLSKGWTSINVSGSQAQMDMMWLEAMRAGLAVTNYKPGMLSEANRAWIAERKGMGGAETAPESSDATVTAKPASAFTDMGPSVTINPTPQTVEKTQAAFSRDYNRGRDNRAAKLEAKKKG